MARRRPRRRRQPEAQAEGRRHGIEASAGVWALLLAAGSGERLAADRPKAFVRLGERPLLAESLERLENSAWIDEIVVAAPADWEEPVILLAEELGCAKVSSCVPGGATRAESARAALAEVPEAAAVVLVHDAARPLVTDEVIERVLGALGEGYEGVVPGIPVADTIKRASGSVVTETLDRSELVAVQTPQAFVASVLREALARNISEASDCASLVERGGGRIKIVEGERRLLKVTDPVDLDLVENWALEERRGPTGEPGVPP